MTMRNGLEGICAANQREISKLISHDHAKICITMPNGPEGGIML